MGNITIIEDTGVLRIRLEKLLSQNGFHNVESTSSHMLTLANAIIFFKESDIIIAELDNHDQEIIKLIKELKKHKETQHTSVIVLSSSTKISTLKVAIAAGCSDFILKPFANETLIEKIRKYVNCDQMNSGTEFGTYDLDEEIQSMQWSNDFEIDIKEIDSEHRGIIERFGKLYGLMNEGRGHEYYIELLLFLEDYVNTHFENEENFQRKIHYNQYMEHKEKHNEFRLKVNEIVRLNKNHVVTSNDLIKINLFVKDWLIHHILIEDKKMGDFLDHNKSH